MQLINAVDFCKPATKSLGNKRYDILEEHIQKVLDLYIDFKDGEYSKIIPNKEFGKYELTIEQPLRDEEGNVVMKAGKKVPDSSKRDTEKVALDCNVKEYFSNEVLPHIDPESWIDYARTRDCYEINFTRYFYKYIQPKPSSFYQEKIKDSEGKVLRMIKELFNNK